MTECQQHTQQILGQPTRVVVVITLKIYTYLYKDHTKPNLELRESDPHSELYGMITASKKSHAPKMFTAQIRLQYCTIPRINEFYIFVRIAIATNLTKSLHIGYSAIYG